MEGKLKKQLPVRTQMIWYLLATVLILVAGGLRVLDRGMYNSFWSVWLQLLRHMIHIGLLIGWMISIQSRILQRPVRRYLLAIGCMLSFWLECCSHTLDNPNDTGRENADASGIFRR